MKKVSDYLNNITRLSYDQETKQTLLTYMTRRDLLEWASTKKIRDRVTGETVFTVCFLGYTDGKYEWTSPETYHLEKYDLALSEEFIRHVMQQKTAPGGTVRQE